MERGDVNIIEELQEALTREVLRKAKAEADTAEIVRAREQTILEWVEKESGVWKGKRRP